MSYAPQANETYVFAIAAYDADGVLLRELGASTPELLLALPLPLYMCWAHLTAVAAQLDCQSIAKKAAKVRGACCRRLTMLCCCCCGCRRGCCRGAAGLPVCHQEGSKGARQCAAAAAAAGGCTSPTPRTVTCYVLNR